MEPMFQLHLQLGAGKISVPNNVVHVSPLPRKSIYELLIDGNQREKLLLDWSSDDGPLKGIVAEMVS